MAQALTPQPNAPLIPGDPRADSMWRQWLAQQYTRVYASSQISHNSLDTLQGGTAGEYYHLTAAQHATITSYAHNNLNGLQGGTTGEYYHLTQSQHTTLTSYQHNDLNNMQGGSAAERYHLTQAQHTVVSTATLGANRIMFANASNRIDTTPGFEFVDATSTATVPHLSITGNTTIGNAGADDVTVNASTWTRNSNIIATRALGAAPAGVTIGHQENTTLSGDSGGTTDARAQGYTVTVSGANSLSGVNIRRSALIVAGTAGTLGTASIDSISLSVINAQDVTNGFLLTGSVSLTSSGSISSTEVYRAAAPTLSGTGAIGSMIGFKTLNLGHATLITRAFGFDADNITAAVTSTASFRSQQNSGTGAWGFLHTGTADNAFNGSVRIGSTVAPTEALDVTGNAKVSGTLTVSSIVVSSFTGPSAADPWTYLTVSTAHIGVSTTSFIDVTGLGFTPGTNSTYEWEAHLMLKTSTASVNPRVGVRWPTGTSSVGWINQAQTNSTQLITWGNNISTMQTGPGLLATTTAAWPAIAGGIIRAYGAAASSFSLQIASETASTFVSTMIGSYLKYRTIP